jgi:hypothetical protein
VLSPTRYVTEGHEEARPCDQTTKHVGRRQAMRSKRRAARGAARQGTPPLESPLGQVIEGAEASPARARGRLEEGRRERAGALMPTQPPPWREETRRRRRSVPAQGGAAGPTPDPRSRVRARGWLVLTQKVHLAPNTQQAEQAGFTRAKSHETCQSIFPEN